MSRLLIIDGNNTMYRAFHSYRMLQNNGNPVSIIYGMPNLVHALINQFKPDKTLICWDHGKHPKRLKLLPDYKGKRKQMLPEQYEDMNNQRNVVYDIFHSLGIQQFRKEGMEADDYIYALVRKFKKKNNITIISTDKDFHQLLCSNVKIYNTSKRILLHHKNIKGHFGYTAEQCLDYLILRGDESDNIPGYRGIGEERAKIFLAEHSSIREFLSSDKSFMKVNKEELEKLYKRNKELIGLRTFHNKNLKGKLKINLQDITMDKSALFKICAKYTIKSFRKKQFIKTYKHNT